MTTLINAPAPTTPDRASIAPKRRTTVRARTIALFIAPFLVLFLAMYVAPIVYSVVNSTFTTHRSGLGLGAPTTTFEPFANYVRAFSDGAFMHSIGRVVLFGVVQVPVMLLLALALALLIDAKSAAGKGFFRLASFLPYAIPGVSAALVWSFMYSPQSSPINHFLGALGTSIPFFDGNVVLWSVANIVTWSWTGYNMIVIYAALQSIPEEVLEAAKLDGAGAFRIAISIKVPMVAGALVLTAVFSIIGSAQLFNEPSVLQPVSSGSISSTYTPVMAAQAAVSAGDYSYAAAESVIVAVLVGVISFVFFTLTSRGQDA